jgi:hypothetical protein
VITDSRAKALKAGNDVLHWQRVEPARRPAPDGDVDRDTAGYSAAQHRLLPEG